MIHNFRSQNLIMKSIAPLLLFLVAFGYAFSQVNEKCQNHPLFSQMAKHTLEGCELKEFDELAIYETDKSGGGRESTKSGEILHATYKYSGEWDTRPSAVQIHQNYINAVIGRGGSVLYKSNSEVYLLLKKSGDQYWIKVSTDGSGYYYLTTLKESKMKQDIVLTMEQIKSDISQEGKAVFYGIYFDTGKSTLKSESGSTIAEMAKYLNVNTTVKVYIVGHTDNTGSYDGNMKLSMERAQAVVNELVKTHSIGMDRIQAAGAGSLAPITSNQMEEGKAKNRRVEMVLM
jgi:outer membrane protein OmpA-like peptidoglycan-associated protein